MDIFFPEKLELMTMPLDMQVEIEDRLDLLSLLSLGGTCMYFRDRVAYTLKKEREAIIEKYWPAPDPFLRTLTTYRAVITGTAALAFIARDRSLLGQELEVCVSADWGHELLLQMENDRFVHHAWNDEQWPGVNNQRPTHYLYRTNWGHFIRIISSHTQSPFTGLTSNTTTALFNYMDKFSFGSAYRDLTVNSRGMSPNFDSLDDDEAERVLHLSHQGGLRQSPWAPSVAVPPVPFALYNEHAGWSAFTAEKLVNTVCLRAMYQCTGQARFFGDRGSLVDFFEPDMVDHAVMAHCGLPPYGPTAIWRMEGPACDYDCVEWDHLLQGDPSAVCVLSAPLHYGPFTTGTIGRPKVGESQHRQVWNATSEDIRLTETGR